MTIISAASHTSYPRLLADIGGTNCRFAMLKHPGDRLSDELNFSCADYPGVLEATQNYLTKTTIKPRWVGIGIATAVTGDLVKMTNLGWCFSQAELCRQLGVEQLKVINDFTALALSLPLLNAAQLMKVGGGETDPDLPIALLGAGTGLGVSGLIPAHQHGEPPHWIPIQGEGGHVSFSPFNHKEDEILRIFRHEFGHVSAERLLSGPGMVKLHQAIAQLNGEHAEQLSASEISARGIGDDSPLCREVVDTFCGMLGTAAANLVITLGALGGLYIGGGIIPKLGDYFAQSPFRVRFEQKGRFSEYLANVASYVITAANPALYGASEALDRLTVQAQRSRRAG